MGVVEGAPCVCQQTEMQIVLRAGMLDAVRQGASSAVLTLCAHPPAPNWLHPKLLLSPAVPDLSLPDSSFCQSSIRLP